MTDHLCYNYGNANSETAEMLPASPPPLTNERCELSMAISDSTTAPCFLYLIQVASGPVKIGIALDVKVRLETLQTANYEELRAVYAFQCADSIQAQSFETLSHRRYHAQHIRGEWYAVQPENIIADIEFAIHVSGVFQAVEINRYKHVLPRRTTEEDQNRVKRLSDARLVAQRFFLNHPEHFDKSLDELVTIVKEITGQAIGRTTLANARNDTRKQMAERGGA